MLFSIESIIRFIVTENLIVAEPEEKLRDLEAQIKEFPDSLFETSVIHLAAGLGNIDTLSLLLKRGEDVNAKDHKGQTPLHWAISMGQEGSAIFLVRNEAQINAEDCHKRTPLDLAFCFQVSQKIVEFLKNNGARANAPERCDEKYIKDGSLDILRNWELLI